MSKEKALAIIAQRKVEHMARLLKMKTKLLNMTSCHVISHPMSNTEIEGKIVFDIVDDGTAQGLDSASDFTGTFGDVKQAMIKEIDSWIEGM